MPAAGMRITHLRRLRGREWLWRNDQLPLALPRPDASYVETADSGGWDECFPTVAPSPLPGEAEGPPLPDHGELWSADWTSSVYDHADGTALASAARGSRLDYEFEREVTLVRDAPLVRFRYRLRHTGSEPFPWLWSSHPLLNVQPGATLSLAGVSQVKLDHLQGRQDLEADDVVSWPGAIGGTAGVFTLPEPAGWAVKLFGDMPADAPLVVTDPRAGERLELTASPAEVPQVGVWINVGGWAPSGRRPYYNLGLEPCIGAPDRLEDAVLRWRTAPVLEPGAERTWGLEVRLPEP